MSLQAPYSFDILKYVNTALDGGCTHEECVFFNFMDIGNHRDMQCRRDYEYQKRR